MRRALSVLSIVLGSLALLVGGAVAFVVGPDDVASLPPTTMPATAHVVTTAPDLLAFRDATVRVSATSDGGAVFVGSGNSVDVASYLAGVHQRSITGLGSRGALVAQDRPASSTSPRRPPRRRRSGRQRRPGPARRRSTSSSTARCAPSPPCRWGRPAPSPSRWASCCRTPSRSRSASPSWAWPSSCCRSSCVAAGPGRTTPPARRSRRTSPRTTAPAPHRRHVPRPGGASAEGRRAAPGQSLRARWESAPAWRSSRRAAPCRPVPR